MPIATAREIFKTATPEEQHARILGYTSVQQVMAILGVSAEQIGDPARPAAGAAPAVAYVNWGRWAADCPEDGCPGAIDVLDGASFLCPSCLNAGIAYRYRPIEMPADREEIEAALEPRLVPATRNWVPGDTPAALRAENEQREIAMRS